MRNKRNKREQQKHHHQHVNINLHIADYKKFIIGILTIIILLIAIFAISKFIFNLLTDLGNSEDIANLNNNQNNTNMELSANETVVKPKNTTINMAFTGDIMCHNTMYEDAYNSSTGEYDFSYYFENIKYYLQTPDITIGNLETTFAGSTVGYSGYPTFNTPEILAKNLKKVGFDVVSTANNHCMDKKYSGLESTISFLDEADLSHTGTYTSKESQDTILIKNVKGIKIAFISFTYGTNGISVPSDKSYAVNFLNEETILSQITLAKEQSPDIICALVHWGTEYQTSPNNNQKDIANLLIENGVNLIIGNHPHVPQPIKLTKNGDEQDIFIAYSLGNFMAAQTKTYTKDSLILNLTITKNGETNEITIDNYDYTPIYTNKKSNVSKQKYEILDIQSEIKTYEDGDTSIGSTLYKTLQTELQNIKNIVEKEV